MNGAVSSGTFSIAEALQFGVSRFREEWRFCLALFAFTELVSLVSAGVIAYQICLLAQLVTQLDSSPPDALLYAFLPVYFVVRAAFQVLVAKALLMLHDGQKPGVSDLLGFDFGSNFPVVMRTLAATIVYGLLSALMTVMFVLPGLFATSVLKFFKFALVEQSADALESLHLSYQLSGESKNSLVGLNIATTTVRTLGLLLLGVGFVPASAICSLAEVFVYKRLSESAAAAEA